MCFEEEKLNRIPFAFRGKTPEWYNKNYGHICSHYLSRIRLAFKHVAEGPESKV